jgi:hypothetical protein
MKAKLIKGLVTSLFCTGANVVTLGYLWKDTESSAFAWNVELILVAYNIFQIVYQITCTTPFWRTYTYIAFGFAFALSIYMTLSTPVRFTYKPKL